MSKLITLAATASAFATRYPHPGMADLQAAAGKDTVDVQASAFRGFTTGDKLVCVKAETLFYVSGQEQPVSIGDVVEVTEAESRYLKMTNKALLATPAEIAAAQKAA